MSIEDFLEQLVVYKAEFYSSFGRQPNTVEEFEQYLRNRQFRINKSPYIKSVNWLFRNGKGRI